MTSFHAASQALQALVLSALFILIAAILLLIFIKGFRRAKAYGLATDIAVLLILMTDTLLLGCVHIAPLKGVETVAKMQPFAALPVSLHLLLIVLAAVWCCIGFIRERKIQRTAITPGSIREALDNLPSALCLATEDGMPVLTNRKMYALADAITGRHLVNAELLWRELETFASGSGIRRIDYAGALAFVLPDGSIWRFTRRTIDAEGVRYVQITATETTRLWGLSKELEQDNIELDRQQQRLQKLLQNIVKIRQAEEILSSKIRLHDRLGRAVLISRRYLLNSAPTDSPQAVVAMWREIAESLQASVFDSEGKCNAAKELTDIADLLGCSIAFDGDFPQNNNLLLAAVREALTNAVRHAGADRLTVGTRRENDQIQIEISDNGKGFVTEVVEGGGLSSLRQRVESAGGRMELCCRGGVNLKLTISGKEGVL